MRCVGAEYAYSSECMLINVIGVILVYIFCEIFMETCIVYVLLSEQAWLNSCTAVNKS
jgi:hypothetical protein